MTKDSQISKVYSALFAAKSEFPEQTRDEVTATVVKIMNSAWFRKRWAANGLEPLLVKQVTIKSMPTRTYCGSTLEPMKRRANAKETPHDLVVTVGPGQDTLIQVLHIITHYLRPGWNHDAEFCKEFLAVVGRFMGAEAKRTMTEIFRAKKVKHRVYSDEARAAARHRFIARDAVPDLLALRDELAT